VWWASRRLIGIAVVGVVTVATVGAALRPSSSGTGVDTVPLTAWVPISTSVVLADAPSARGVTAVSPDNAGGTYRDPIRVTQVGTSAIAMVEGFVMALQSRTWISAVLQSGVPGDAFVVGGTSIAWLLYPAAGNARPVDVDAAPVHLGEPVAVGAGVDARHARATDDGTLWILGPTQLRGLRPNRSPIEVPLAETALDRALTLVDGDPVVVDARVARHVDRVSGTVDREWPVGLAEGPHQRTPWSYAPAGA
jgi:hypothetical protein